MPRISNAKAIDAIRAREPFDNNSSTFGGRRSFNGWGKLPDPPNIDKNFIDYWVYSYDTPIAWVWRDGTAEMPQAKLSTTTSEHQRITAAALGLRVPSVQLTQQTCPKAPDGGTHHLVPRGGRQVCRYCGAGR